MALKFVDGFDHYASADILSKWSSFSGSVAISAGNGRRSSQALSYPSSTTAVLAKTLSASGATWTAGFAIFPRSGTVTAGMLFQFTDSGSDQIGIRLNADLTLQMQKQSTTLGSASVATLTANVWQYVEVKVVVNNTTGTYEVRLNGVNILSATGQNTRNTANNSANGVRFGARASDGLGGAGVTTGIYIDDFYVCDSTGTNTTFLGDSRVDTLYPTGAGNTTQFTASAGSNWQCVDETLQNGDSDYVQSSTATNKDTYGFSDLSHTPTSVFGVQINMYAKKDDAGSRTLCAVTRSGGSDTDGATQGLNTSYSNLIEVLDTDPNGSIAWTKAAVNAAEFGMKVVA
jgi:hypothetical protein